MSATSQGQPLGRQIRKLRKKLRQIENLERLSRQLQQDERFKLSKKTAFRERLLDLLAQHTEEDGGNASSIYSAGDSSLASDDWTEPDESMHGMTPDPDDSEDADSDNDNDVTEEHRESCPEVKVSPPVATHRVAQDTKTVKKDASPSLTVSQAKKTKSGGHEPINILRKKWKNSFCFIRELEDHSDIVNDLVVEGNTLVTASRDTTVKVWDLEKGRQLRNLGGHTESVTSVFLLSNKSSQYSSLLPEKSSSHRLVVSGSIDCCFKVWDSQTGTELKSVYTYNPITKLVCDDQGHVITGSDGGKIEIWDMETGENIHSLLAFEGAVTGMKISGNQIYAASSTGVVKVFQLRDNSLACMFESEKLKSTSGSRVTPRFVRSLTSFHDTVYFGDDAINIKALEWKAGLVRKLPNHVEEFASTDAICCIEDILVSSSYDLDSGLGYVNIRTLPKGDYLATLDDEDTERITCIGCTRMKSGNLLIVTGGLQLKFWEIDAIYRPSQEESLENAIRYIPRLTRPGRDSDIESDTDLSEDDLDLQESDLEEEGSMSSVKEAEAKSSWFSYCVIL